MRYLIDSVEPTCLGWCSFASIVELHACGGEQRDGSGQPVLPRLDAEVKAAAKFRSSRGPPKKLHMWASQCTLLNTPDGDVVIRHYCKACGCLFAGVKSSHCRQQNFESP